jgi:hypothetical protein
MNAQGALEAARERGIAVSVEDLGDWKPAHLLSEYDARARTIRVNSQCVEILERKFGAQTVDWFIACAVSHELYHALVPGGSEEDAHAFALLQTGTSPQAFEAMFEGC